MKTLHDILKNNPDYFVKHPRFKFIDEMWIRINKDREGTKYKPITKRIVALKTAHLSLDDMGFLLKKMQQSHYPGKVFFGALKVKDNSNEDTAH